MQFVITKVNLPQT